MSKNVLLLLVLVPNLQDDPQWPVSENSHPCIVPSHIISGFVYVTIRYGRNDGISLLKLGYKRHYSYHLGHVHACSLARSLFLSLSQSSLALGMLAAMSWKALWKGETPSVERFTWQGTEAYCQHPWESEPSWKWVHQPWSRFQVTAALIDILTAISWETLNQSHPARKLPASWPSEIVWDDKCLLSQAFKFRGDLFMQ